MEKFLSKKTGLFFLIAVITIISVFGVNNYKFGIQDQVNELPFIKSDMKAALYPNDYFIPEKNYHYTYLWKVIELASQKTNISLEVLFFYFYILSVFLTFLSQYMLAYLLFKRHDVAILSLFFLMFPREVLSGVHFLDDHLLTRTVVMPLMMFALYFVLKGPGFIVPAMALTGLGFLVHPLTAAPFFAAIFFVYLINIKETGIKNLLAGLGIFTLVSLPMIMWRLKVFPQGMPFFIPDRSWMEILRIRSPHHFFPFSFKPMLYIETAGIIIFYLFSFKYGAGKDFDRRAKHFAAAVFLLCAAGIIFSEIFPLAIVINLTLFMRVFVVFVMLVFVYISNSTVNILGKKGSRRNTLIVAVLLLLMFVHVKYAKIVFPLFAGVMICYALIARKKGNADTSIFFALLLTAMTITGVYGFEKDKGFSILNAQSKEWLETQKWAKENTPDTALFVVPPMETGFRVESERSIYGEWKDGAYAVYNPAFGSEWMRRMKNLGFEGRERFRSLAENDYEIIKSEYKDKTTGIFALRKTNEPGVKFSRVFSNKEYAIYKIK